MTTPFALQNILVPTDLSLAGLDAVRYGRSFADHFGAKLTIFYVDPVIAFGMDGPMYIRSSPSHTAKLEEDVRAYAGQVLQGFPHAVFAAAGQPVPVIIHEAEERRADLIIMATHGLGGWRRAILGSVTQGVLHGGDCPVLSLRRGDPQLGAVHVKTVVCPVNFTDVARKALEYAIHITKAFDAELLVVHVVEEKNESRQAADGAMLRSWIAASVPVNATYREVVLRGGAAERVLDFAEDAKADLLIAGAQHKIFRDETVIGTTTERLVRFARLPVLSVPRTVDEVKHRTTEDLLVAVP